MKTLKTLACASVLALSMNTVKTANAGVGLAWESIQNVSSGRYLLTAVGGGMAVASIRYAVESVINGQYAFGAFFLILKENNVITNADYDLLINAEVSTQEAFAEIMASEEMTAEEKQEELAVLFN